MIEAKEITEDRINEMFIDLIHFKMGLYPFFKKYGIGIQTGAELKKHFQKMLKLSTPRIDKK